MENHTTLEEKDDQVSRSAKAWLRKLVASGAWACFFLLARGIQVPFGEGSYWAIAAVLLGAMTSLYAFSGIPTFVVYVLTFPVWAPIALLYWCAKLLRMPYRLAFDLCARLGRMYRSPIAAALHFPVSLALVVFAVLSVSPANLRTSLVGLLVVTVDLMFMAFFIIPSLALSREALRLARWFLKEDRLESGVFSRRLREWPDEKLIGRAVGQLKFYADGKRWLCDIFEKLVSVRAMVASFIGLFVLTFLFVSLNYGAIFFAAWKLDENFFGCLKIKPNFADALFFSLSSITTSGLSRLCPLAPQAKLLVSTELICGLVLLSVLGIAFATLHLLDVEDLRSEWGHEMQMAENRIEDASMILDLLPELAKRGRIPDPEEAPEVQIWVEKMKKASQSRNTGEHANREKPKLK